MDNPVIAGATLSPHTPIKRPRGRPRKDPSLTKVEPVKTAVAVLDDNSTVFHAMPQQAVFLEATQREVLMSGGRGSGKSCALLVDMVTSVAGRPGSRAVLARRYLAGLTRSTLAILLKPTGSMPAILPPGQYEYRQSEGIIKVHGGGEIVLVGIDHAERIRSINATDLYVDEAAEITKDMYSELLEVVRVSSGRGHVRLATNPSWRGHWLHTHFMQARPDRAIIYGNSLDNQYLTQEYRKYLSELTGDRRERMVYGKWTAQGDMVYPQWSSSMVIPQNHSETDGNFYLCIDFGQTHPTGILFAREDSDGKIHILDEFYRTSATFREILNWCEQFRQFNPQVVYDPSARSVATEFEAKSWANIQKADNDVGVGIARVQDRMGAGLIEVDPQCVNLVNEINGYSWDPNHLGKPIKEIDDLADCLRYCTLACSIASIGQTGSISSIFFA